MVYRDPQSGDVIEQRGGRGLAVLATDRQEVTTTLSEGDGTLLISARSSEHEQPMPTRSEMEPPAAPTAVEVDTAVLTAVRARSADTWRLHETAALDALGNACASWVDGKLYDPRAADARKVAFDRDGFLVMRGFADLEEVGAMRAHMRELAEKWDPATELVQFRTDAGQDSAQARSDYFLDSADAVHFFAEPDAVDEATGKLRVPKQEALNKAGHGLHVPSESPFGRYARSMKLGELVAALGWRDPVLPQSMYIYKQVRVLVWVCGGVGREGNLIAIYFQPDLKLCTLLLQVR
ncbi:hypothetical protein T492DRAFT_181469 [Pavlovales sp. CCMP2436]|nr:hypothetical protein T492DRAFT_181469 [Pavlovales sp. CCMP2436]